MFEVFKNIFVRHTLNTDPSQTDLKEILKERTTQYKKRKKIPSDVSVMTDDEDQSSYHPSVWFKNKIVAGARVIPLSDDRPSESEKYTEWPDWFPPRNQCVDVARLFVVSEGKDIKTLESLLRGIVICALKENRRYVTGFTTKQFLPFYTNRISAKYSDKGFKHGDVGGSEHFMACVDLEEILRLDRAFKFRLWFLIAPRASLFYSKHVAPNQKINHIILTILLIGQSITNTLVTLVSRSRRSVKVQLMN